MISANFPLSLKRSQAAVSFASSQPFSHILSILFRLAGRSLNLQRHPDSHGIEDHALCLFCHDLWYLVSRHHKGAQLSLPVKPLEL